MASANIDLADGTKIVIEGSPEEIARVLSLYKHASTAIVATGAAHGRSTTAPRSHSRQRRRGDANTRANVGVMQHLRDLIGDEYFSQRRPLSDVRSKLEELGHVYPLTHLSTPMRRLVVNKELRRLRDGKIWVYVNG
jgi:hypothetical protein